MKKTLLYVEEQFSFEPLEWSSTVELNGFGGIGRAVREGRGVGCVMKLLKPQCQLAQDIIGYSSIASYVLAKINQ